MASFFDWFRAFNRESEVSPSARAVGNAMATRADSETLKFWITIQDIAEFTRLSPRHIIRMTDELNESEWVVRRRRGAFGRASEYALSLPHGDTDVMLDGGPMVTPVSAHGDTHVTPMVTPVSVHGDTHVTPTTPKLPLTPPKLPLASDDTVTEADAAAAASNVTSSERTKNRKKPTSTPPLDEAWRPTAEQWSKLEQKHEGKNLETELEKFKAWHIKKRSKYKNWYRAFDNWLKKANMASRSPSEVIGGDYDYMYRMMEEAPF